MFTDLDQFYQEPAIIPPVPVDEGADGVPSDHNGVLVLPLCFSEPTGKTKRQVSVRPITESAIESFGQSFVNESWSFLNDNVCSTDLVQMFQDHSSSLINLYFPLKTVNISAYDQPYFNERLRSMRRHRQREYRKHGKSEKYFEIKLKFKEAMKNEALKYKEKIISEVVEGKRGSAYKAIQKLGDGNNNNNDHFEIPSHTDRNLSYKQSADVLAAYFSAISQEFEPLNPEKFTPDLKDKLATVNDETIPQLEEHIVYKKICSAKKPNSSVPGDLPKKIVINFAVELALPMTIIFNKITRSGLYPRQWVVEYQTPIPKLHPPASEDDIRNISGTQFFSKVHKGFLCDWLLPIVRPFLDPANCGGLRGTSTNHYLIRMLHFIHSNVDKSTPHAVVLALVDLSKAFNRVDHLLLIQDLHDMYVPGWLLRILISYLTRRRMILRFRGAASDERLLPGSSPQGVLLGCFFFMVKFNGALLRPNIPRPFLKPVPMIDSKAKSCTVKYIDDASQACTINLKEDLSKFETSDRPRPLQFFEHTGLGLKEDSNQLQFDLNNLKMFTDRNLMTINQKKTQIMCINFRKSLQFPPVFRISDGQQLDIVKQTKLLGIIFSDDLRWSHQVDYMCKRALKKIWLLRRLKTFDLDHETLLDFYCKEIRSILEYGHLAGIVASL